MYRDATQIEHTSSCQQPLVRADQIESQVVEYLKRTLKPRKKGMLLGRFNQQKENIETRWKRVQTLYLVGEIDRDQYEDEKNRREELEKALLNQNQDAIIPQGQEIYQGLIDWDRILPIEKKRLFRLVLETVFVRESALVGMQPSFALHPLFSGCCSSGDDGD